MTPDQFDLEVAELTRLHQSGSQFASPNLGGSHVAPCAPGERRRKFTVHCTCRTPGRMHGEPFRHTFEARDAEHARLLAMAAGVVPLSVEEAKKNDEQTTCNARRK